MTLVTDQGLRPFPVQKLLSRPLSAPRLHAFPGAAGCRQRSPESSRVRGARRPHCGPGRRCRLPSPRPGRPHCSSELPRIPANLPRGRCSAHAHSPTSSLVGSGFRVRTRGSRAGPLGGTPYSPISPSSSSSSSCSISNKTSLFIFCMAPQKAAPNLARSWGSRVPERRGSRRPGAGAGTAGGASHSRLRGRRAQPAPREAEPKRPPTRTQRPRLPLARRGEPGH